MDPSVFSKIRPCRSLDTEDLLIDNYQTAEVENPYSRYDIVESWMAVWLSDPKVPDVLGSF